MAGLSLRSALFGAVLACATLAQTACGPIAPGRAPTAAVQDARAHAEAFRSAVSTASMRPVTWNNRTSLAVDRDVLPALRAMLAGARKSIFFETFEFNEDASGVAMADLLIKRKREGIDVRVIIDQLGSDHLNTHIPQRLRDHGVPTTMYGPFPFWRREGKGYNITHRKLYLVDGDQAMTGGMNVGDDYFFKVHDMLWKIEGEAAQALHEEFVGEWARARGEGTLSIPPLASASYGNEPIGIAVTSPLEKGREREIHQTFLAAVDKAQTRVDMAYPYFWDDDLVARLEKARARGVQVRVILTTHDADPGHALNAWTAWESMSKGLEFHWYDRSYSHIKYCIVDDAFLMAGSSNADTLTFTNNQELDPVFTNPATIADFRQRVSEPDWASTPAITAKEVAIGGLRKPIYELLDLLGAYM